MQRVIGTLRQLAINGNQVLNARDLTGQDDLSTMEANFLGLGGRLKGRGNHRVAHDLGRIQRLRSTGIFVHYSRQQFLIEAAPINADTHRLIVFAGQLDHLGELLILFFAETDVTRIDPIFGQRLGTGRMVGQQSMAVVMKITDQRHIAIHPVEVIANFRYGGSGLRRIHRDADQLGACPGQLCCLQGGGQIVRGIGVGH